MEVLVFSCLSESPDIYFLSLGQGDAQCKMGDVDAQEALPVYANSSLKLKFEKQGNHVAQIMTGSPGTGFSFATVHQDRDQRAIALWDFLLDNQ
jgi:hypothetical protein